MRSSRGTLREALRAFAETVRQDSDNIDAYIHLANLLRETRRPRRVRSRSAAT
jgi:hypothetical protein